MLQAQASVTEAAFFSDNGKVKPGDELIVLELTPGTPPGPDFVTSAGTVKVTSGANGIANYVSVLDIERPNRNGALLLDRSGGLVGLIVRNLDNRLMLDGDIELWGGPPAGFEGLRDSVADVVLRHLLDHYIVAYEAARPGPELLVEEVATRARDFTTLIECRR